MPPAIFCRETPGGSGKSLILLDLHHWHPTCWAVRQGPAGIFPLASSPKGGYMLKKLSNRQKGFTLIELLIVIAIIGIIAALLIPNFLDALQKGKQKRTMGDMKDMGTAMFSWVTDQAGAAAAGADVDLGDYESLSASALASVLVSQYIQDIPSLDGWR